MKQKLIPSSPKYLMNKVQLLVFLISLTIFTTANSSRCFAQDLKGYSKNSDQNSSLNMDGPLTDVYTVFGAGAVGAVLGLSTLSFEDEPSKSFKNVSVGAAIGIIFGVGLVIYNQVTRTSTTIYSDNLQNDDHHQTSLTFEKQLWAKQFHSTNFQKETEMGGSSPQSLYSPTVSYTFNF